MLLSYKTHAMNHLIFLLSCLLLIFSCANPSPEEEVADGTAQLHAEDSSEAMEPMRAPDTSLRFKLPQGSYQNLANKLKLNAVIGQHADMTTWWYEPPAIDGYIHSINAFQGPYPELSISTPRWVMVYVRPKGARAEESLFSYSLLSGDAILFETLADTVHADMIRGAVSKMLKE